MTNSLVRYLKEYVCAEFKDLAYAYTHQSEWKRDNTRLLHELEINGNRVLTVDLPAIGKVLDKSLDEGSVQHSLLYQLRYSSCSAHKVPKLFGELWRKIFDSDGKLRESPCIDAISALRQLYLSGKKLKLECSKKGVDDEVRNFFIIEQGLRAPTNLWVSDSVDFSATSVDFVDAVSNRVPSDPWIPGIIAGEDESRALKQDDHSYPTDETWYLTTLQHVCDRIAVQFGDLHDEGPLELPKHGPGVVANQRKGTSKYQFAEWPTKLSTFFPYDYYALPNYSRVDNGRDIEEMHTLNESPSRLIAVPKTLTKPRLIAAEPNQHQWIQQLVRNQLEGRLDKTQLGSCIKFRSQDRNQSMAIRGSVDGSNATIDLSSASDRLSCYVVERMFRKNLTILERLHAARTRWIVNAVSDRSPRHAVLRKFAAQGSAVTFPVQSIFYACVAVTAVILKEGCPVSSRSIERAVAQVSVFGDDIIVPQDCMRVTVIMLERLGLKVNHAKSFGTGKFRESCGVDAYGGYNVTPAYLLSPDPVVPLTGCSSAIEVSNNFWKKGLWHTSKCVESTMKLSGKLIPIIAPASGILGLVSFCGDSFSHLAKRWDERLHRTTYRAVQIVTKQRTIPTEWSYRLFQWFIEKPQPDTFWESGTRAPTVVLARPGWVCLETSVPTSNS